MKSVKQNILPMNYEFTDMLLETLQKIETTITESDNCKSWKAHGVGIHTEIDNSYVVPRLLIKANTKSGQNIVLTIAIGLGTISFPILYEIDGVKHEHFYHAYSIEQLFDGINKVFNGKGW